jgi:hypothetical protein
MGANVATRPCRRRPMAPLLVEQLAQLAVGIHCPAERTTPTDEMGIAGA